jgi:hypothetical protein
MRLSFRASLTELPFRGKTSPRGEREEANMQNPATEMDQMIVQLNEFILPSSLMESLTYTAKNRSRVPLGASMMHSSHGFWTC